MNRIGRVLDASNPVHYQNDKPQRPTGIRCGSCKGRHPSVADVRACYGNGTPAAPIYAEVVAVVQDFNANLVANPQTLSGTDDAHECPICERFCLTPGDHRTICPLYDKSLDSGRRSADGDPSGYGDPQPAKADAKAVPAGYYATKSRTGNNDLDFWLVQDGKGKWSGYKFVKRILGGHAPQYMRKQEQWFALNRIAESGIEAGNKLFAAELGRCYKCGKDLTDETSRALGIGPTCRAKAA